MFQSNPNFDHFALYKKRVMRGGAYLCFGSLLVVISMLLPHDLDLVVVGCKYISKWSGDTHPSSLHYFL